MRGYVEDAGLTRHDQPAIRGHTVAAGAEAVAIQSGHHPFAVGGDNQRGAVPGLHQCAVILVEGAAIGVHVAVLFPGLWDEHAQGMREAAAGYHQQLQHIIQLRTVAETLPGQRLDLFDVVAEAR